MKDLQFTGVTRAFFHGDSSMKSAGQRRPNLGRLAVDMRPHERQRQPLRPSMSCDLAKNDVHTVDG